MNHVMSRKHLLRTALLTLKQCSQRPGRMDMPGMTLPRQIKRLICTINLRRVFGGRLEFVGPLIVLEICVSLTFFLCPHERLSYRTLNLAWRIVVNVWLLCPSHVVAPAILQSLIVPLCSPRGCCVVLAVSERNIAKCSFSAVCPHWEAFDQLRCCVCFRVSLLACSAPWLSGVLSE